MYGSAPFRPKAGRLPVQEPLRAEDEGRDSGRALLSIPCPDLRMHSNGQIKKIEHSSASLKS